MNNWHRWIYVAVAALVLWALFGPHHHAQKLAPHGVEKTENAAPIVPAPAPAADTPAAERHVASRPRHVVRRRVAAARPRPCEPYLFRPCP